MSEQTDLMQTVVAYFRMPDGDETALHVLERALVTAIADAGAGVYEGHEVALLEGDDAYLFMCGPDADRLFEAVRPVLSAEPLTSNATVTLRYGPPELAGVDERSLQLGAV